MQATANLGNKLPLLRELTGYAFVYIADRLPARLSFKLGSSTLF